MRRLLCQLLSDLVVAWGGNEGTCGALSGAIAVVSLIKSDNNESKEEIYDSVKKIIQSICGT